MWTWTIILYIILEISHIIYYCAVNIHKLFPNCSPDVWRPVIDIFFSSQTYELIIFLILNIYCNKNIWVSSTVQCGKLGNIRVDIDPMVNGII